MHSKPNQSDITKPLIGISENNVDQAYVYVEAIEQNGGVPWIVNLASSESAEDAVAKVDGLLVGSERPTTNNGENFVCTETSARKEVGLQKSLLLTALKTDVPLLCISEGMHSLNLALGGTLGPVAGHGAIQQDDQKLSSYHRIFIAPGSKLAATVGSGGFVRVNSRHCLGITEAWKSPLLLASAYSLEDGVIEALESPSHHWVIGVQFQPDRRLEIPPHFYRLFGSLVARAETLPPESLT